MFFYCYSKRLKEFLSSLGFRYECCALNPNNHAVFWCYVKSKELNQALDKWGTLTK